MFRKVLGSVVASALGVAVVIRAYDPSKRYVRSTTIQATPSAAPPPPTASTAATAATASTAAAPTTTAAAKVSAANSERSLSHEPSKLVTLSDGRRLSFQQFGRPNGKAVFVFHSSGASRFEIESLGVRTAV